MPTVGEQLRAAREARNLTVQNVAEATNMRTDHVQALEDGDYTPFPAPVYIRGSVRTYARLLKLDVPAIMATLSAEMGQQVGGELTSSGPRKGFVDLLAYQAARFGWKRGLILLVLLVLAWLIWAVPGWLAKSRSNSPATDLPPASYQPPRGKDGGYLPLTVTNQPAR
jgi:cytoskeletal protein RodZ